MFARKQAGATGRTDRTGGIGLSEYLALGGKAVDFGSLVVGAAGKPKIPGAKIVGDHEDDVGPGGNRISAGARQKQRTDPAQSNGHGSLARGKLRETRFLQDKKQGYVLGESQRFSCLWSLLRLAPEVGDKVE